MSEPKLPAWQDVLGEAEQVVRQKPIFAKHIKGTVLENDVPVWMATFAQQAVMRDRAKRHAGVTIHLTRDPATGEVLRGDGPHGVEGEKS